MQSDSVKLQFLLTMLILLGSSVVGAATPPQNGSLKWSCTSNRAKFDIKIDAPIDGRTLGAQSHGFDEQGYYQQVNRVGSGFSVGIIAKSENRILKLTLHTETYVVLEEKPRKKFGPTIFKDYEIRPTSPLHFEVSNNQFSCDPDKGNAEVAKKYAQPTGTTSLPDPEANK